MLFIFFYFDILLASLGLKHLVMPYVIHENQHGTTEILNLEPLLLKALWCLLVAFQTIIPLLPMAALMPALEKTSTQE